MGVSNNLPSTILIAEPDQKTLLPLQQWLAMQGYVVTAVQDGQEALQKAQGSAFHLIILNYHLPGKTGLEICRVLKNHGVAGLLPVFVLMNTDGDAQPAFDAGADEVLRQPLTKGDLLSRVSIWLATKRRFDTLQEENERLTQDLAARNNELEFALRESRELQILKDSIVRNVSHELRTPLLQVKSSVAMLAEDARADSPSGISILADHATAATARLESVILNITQLASTMNIKLEPFRLIDAVNLALRQLSRQWASSSRVDRIKASVDDVPLLMGDRGAVSQVFQQLLDNATKFSPNGGPVEIVTERIGSNVRIAVRDYGIGIPDNQVERIFQAFYQVDNSTTRTFGGTGVGLAIVKLLLDGMETKIQVESKPGEGSTFSFLLPVAKVEGATVSPPTVPPTVPPPAVPPLTSTPVPVNKPI